MDAVPEYDAAFDEPRDLRAPGAQPWAVFRVTGARVERYIPHRVYVPVADHWDLLAIWFSSDANATRPVTGQEATAYLPGTRDIDGQTLAGYERTRPDPAPDRPDRAGRVGADWARRHAPTPATVPGTPRPAVAPCRRWCGR